MVFACEGISDRTVPVCFGEEAFGIDHYRAVTDLLAEYQVPVIMDLDIGHMAPMMPVVTGAMAKAHVQGNTFVLDYEWRPAMKSQP